MLVLHLHVVFILLVFHLGTFSVVFLLMVSGRLLPPMGEIGSVEDIVMTVPVTEGKVIEILGSVVAKVFGHKNVDVSYLVPTSKFIVCVLESEGCVEGIRFILVRTERPLHPVISNLRYWHY
jgi:hypothetical protein